MFENLLNFPSVWEKICESKLPVICYGTGNGADKIFDELLRLNIKISAVMASDGFVRERFFRGFKVKSLKECENEFGKFIIVICFGSQLKSVIENIKIIGNSFETLVPTVSVYGDGVFSRNFLETHLAEFEFTYNLLADEKSKQVFLDLLNFEYSGNPQYLFKAESTKDEVFSDILKLNIDESYIDLGAYKGDTVNEFLHYCKNRYKSIIAVEPDRKNFKKLAENTDRLERITLINKGIWKEKTTLEFKNSGGRNSSIAKSSENKVDVDSVDNILCGKKITYLKADTEGAESEMLSGAEKTLSHFKPKLNIAAYHKIEDLYLLPQKINKLNPEYKIYLRHHRYMPAWDTNLYCI